MKKEITEKKSPEKETLKSLAEELKQRIAKEIDENAVDYSEKKDKKARKEDVEEDIKEKIKEELKEDLSDKEIEEISHKITKKDVVQEAEEIRKKGKEAKETLIPLEDYIKCAVHLGTKVITPHMRKFVYKRRADGLAVINTVAIDERLKEAIAFLIKYEAKDIYIACKREAGWPAVKKFEEITGIRAFTKKYPPGVTTNLKLENFFEAELTIICDPWIDKNALKDSARLKKPLIGLCDTNNFITHVTKIIPCNNKARKSIGCILFILAREYTKAKGMPFNTTIEDFTGKLEELEPKSQ
jgi:small subunit ribosomal protein S2